MLILTMLTENMVFLDVGDNVDLLVCASSVSVSVEYNNDRPLYLHKVYNILRKPVRDNMLSVY